MKRTYWTITKSMFSASDVRLYTIKDWLIVSLIAMASCCTPASIVVGAVFVFTPKPEDPIWMFMLIPWIIIGPLIPLAIYGECYKKPRKRDRIITRLFGEVRTDIPVQLKDDNSYTFTKNGYVFGMYFKTMLAKGVVKRKRAESIHLFMLFDYPVDDASKEEPLTELMEVYLKEKPIGRCIYVYNRYLIIGLVHKYVSDLDIKAIVSEFLYLAERFKLRPLTFEDHYFNKAGTLLRQ